MEIDICQNTLHIYTSILSSSDRSAISSIATWLGCKRADVTLFLEFHMITSAITPSCCLLYHQHCCSTSNFCNNSSRNKQQPYLSGAYSSSVYHANLAFATQNHFLSHTSLGLHRGLHLLNLEMTVLIYNYRKKIVRWYHSSIAIVYRQAQLYQVSKFDK